MYDNTLRELKLGLNVPAKPLSYSGIGMLLESLDIVDINYNTDSTALVLELKVQLYRTREDKDPNPGKVDKTPTLIRQFEVVVPSSGILGSKQTINIAWENTRVNLRKDNFTIGRKINESSLIFNFKKPSKNESPKVSMFISRRSAFPDYVAPTVLLLRELGVDYTQYEYINFYEPTPTEIQEWNSDILDRFRFDPITLSALTMYTKVDYSGEVKLTAKIMEDILDIYNDVGLTGVKYSSSIGQKTPLDFTYLDYDNALALYIKSKIKLAVNNMLNEVSRKFENAVHKTDTMTIEEFFSTRNEWDISAGHISSIFYGFKNDMESDVNITQQALDSNPLSSISQKSKIIFKLYSSKSGKQEKVKIIPSKFVGIVDPIFTADSNEVNSKNLMAMSATLDGNGSMTIELLDKKFNKVQVPLETYLKSAVLSSSNVDYNHNKIHPDANGYYSIYRLGAYEKTKNPDEIDYYRTENGVVSDSIGIMPFANRTAPMRVMLGSHMVAEQSIPVKGSRPPILYTGVTKKIYDESDLNVKSPVDGTLEEITDDFILIREESGKQLILNKPKDKVTSKHSTNFFHPTIKVGDKIKSGDIIFTNNSFKDGELALGVPLFCAFTSYHGIEIKL